MIPLSVTTGGYLGADNPTLSIATGGYLSYEEIVATPHGNGSAPAGGWRPRSEMPREMVRFENLERKRELEREDEEIVLVASQMVLRYGTFGLS